MGERTNRTVTYLTDEEAKQLSEWSDEVDKSESALLRQAVLEYLDHDRTDRIETKVDCIQDTLSEIKTHVQSDGTHTHTNSTDKKSSVPAKARQIARRLYDNHSSPIKTSDVEIAIEDLAGGDDRTLNKYHEQLKKRGLLYEHPNSPVWTDDKSEWVGWVEGAYHNPDVHEVTQEYSMSTTEYAQLAEATDK